MPPRSAGIIPRIVATPIAGNYCPEGCYWPCEHRASEAARAAPERWRLGPGGGDDPEERALDEWRHWSAAALEPDRSFRAREFCTDCGESFTDAATHAHEHGRRRQLGFDV